MTNRVRSNGDIARYFSWAASAHRPGSLRPGVFALGVRSIYLLAGLLVIACGEPTERPQSTQVVLALNPVPHSALPIIAQTKGYFEEEGLDVTIREFTTGRLAFDAVLAGGADLATVAETPIMYAGFSGQPVYLVATIESSPLSVKILARRDRGVSAIGDLRGKNVGTFRGGSAEYFLNRFLLAHGMTAEDVRITYLAPPELVAALVRGDLAAISIWEPHIYTALQAIGDQGVVFTGEEIYTETFNIAVLRSYADEHSDVIDAFLRALVKAESFLEANAAEAKQILIQSLSVDSLVLEEAIWPHFSFNLSLGEDLLEQIRRQAVFAVETGVIPEGSAMPEYRSMFAPEFLRRIDSARVTLAVRDSIG